jgi:phage terminase large subunit
MKTTAVFDKLYDAWREHPRYVSSCGGARSSKTYSMLELLFYLASTYDKAGDVTSVVSETFPHLKRGAIRDFKNIIGESWDEDAWSKSESIYTLQNGAIIEFFSADAVGKVHGPQRKRLFLNEVQNIPYETARQLFIRTQDTVFMDYNPTHSFWVNEVIETRDDCRLVHSTYKDNPFLSSEQIREIESNKNDKNWWRVYGLGLVGQLEGLIFPDFEQIDELPEGLVETYGQDYGFTNDPSTMIHTKIDTARKALYFDEVYYRKGMLNADMAREMEGAGVPKRGTPIFGDCAEPKTIAELCTYGYNVQPCYKATRKAEQLQEMRGWKIYVTKRSLNLIRELRGYVWQTDKDGKQLNEPIGVNDHTLDAARYSVTSWLYQYRGRGQYCFR